MPDTTPIPTPATDSALLGTEATGIYAPMRLIHEAPQQRYGGYAGLIILAHALLFALVLLRLDFMSDAPAASSPETLDIIVVDLSSTSELAEAIQPATQPPIATPDRTTAVSAQPAAGLPTESPDIPTEARSTPPFEIVPTHTPTAPENAPTPMPTPRQNTKPVPEAPKTISSPPAPRTAPSQTGKTSAAATASSANSRQEAVGDSSKESELTTTPPRLDPAYLHNPAPMYPALSKRNRETGIVLLLVNVNPEGNATSVTLHKSSGYDRLDQAAIQAVNRWRFVPGMRGQSTVSATVIVPISFKQP